MNKSEIYDHLNLHNKKAKKYIVDHGMEGYVIGTFLHGSQNYNLDTKESDVDTISIFVPTCDYAILHKPENGCFIMDDKVCAGEHCNIKDIRNWVNEILKSNPNAIEILYTDYFICEKSFNWFKIGPVDYFYMDLERLLNAANGIANQYLRRKDKKGYIGYARTRFFINFINKISHMTVLPCNTNPYYISENDRQQIFYNVDLIEGMNLYDSLPNLKNDLMNDYKSRFHNIEVNSAFKERKRDETICHMLELIKESEAQ